MSTDSGPLIIMLVDSFAHVLVVSFAQHKSTLILYKGFNPSCLSRGNLESQTDDLLLKLKRRRLVSCAFVHVSIMYDILEGFERRL